MFSSVLIANRGEIACRIIRTARRLGLRAVAVYSDADAGALHVRAADEAHRIGPGAAALSYLSSAAILAAARHSGAQCIHPGYGFLSENAEFAESCAAAGIAFVGPSPAAIRAMGLKGAAKSLMQKAGVPVVRGYHGANQEPKFLRERAYEIGYPVLIKAVAGGGGKGMRRVDAHADFFDALDGARREAEKAFGNASVLVEKYVDRPRHIEMQVLADGHGGVVHLFERDCSLQRRHQKVIEEAPAPGMGAEMRAAMGQAAVAAARAVQYCGAGTVEFIVDSSKGLRPDGFFFMEMNTRLQVEHPVTEMITGLDLVEWQFRVAAGESLGFTQEDVKISGHAVEARLYAEDPEREFLPSTGRLAALRLPKGEGVRVDSGVAEGDEITPFYDPMIAKIIAHGESRDAALDRLDAALADAVVMGPKCNLAFLRALCAAQAFRAGAFDTGFIAANAREIGAFPQPPAGEAVAAGVAFLLRESILRLARRVGPERRQNPFDALDGFQLLPQRRHRLEIIADDERMNAAIFIRQESAHGAGPRFEIDLAELSFSGGGLYAPPSAEALRPSEMPPLAVAFGDGVLVFHKGRQTHVRLFDPLDIDAESGAAGDGDIRAPMHGRLVAVLAALGDIVARGQKLAILEAMKMEHTLLAPHDGIVQEIAAAAGQQVAQGQRLMAVAPAAGQLT